MLAGEERALQVHVHLVVPDRFVHGDRVARFRAPDVVDQDVDAAEPGQACLHDRLDVGGLRHVAGLDFGDAAFLADQVPGDLRGLQVEVAAEDGGALPGQQDGDRLAVSPAFADRSAARDQGDLFIESEHRALRRVGHTAARFGRFSHAAQCWQRS